MCVFGSSQSRMRKVPLVQPWAEAINWQQQSTCKGTVTQQDQKQRENLRQRLAQTRSKGTLPMT